MPEVTRKGYGTLKSGGTLDVTQFEGQYKTVVVDVAGSTTATILTISELSAVISCAGALRGAPTAACGYVSVVPAATTATNVVNVVLYKSDLVNTTTQTTVDSMITVIGY